MIDTENALTEKQRLAALELCYHAICEIRYLCFDGQAQRAGLLTDAIHRIIQMGITGQGSIREIEQELSYYHSQYGDSQDYGRFDYMQLVKKMFNT